MSAGPVSDRVYRQLRHGIMERQFRPGERLDGGELADQLTSSVTPIRDALYRLVGEGLVATHSGEGFYVPAVDVPGLVDLYRWSSDVMLLATRRIRSSADAGPESAWGDSLPERTANLFVAIARRSENLEHVRAAGDCNARLSAVRLVEPAQFPDLEAEFAMLVQLYRSGLPVPLRAALRRYHARREKQASGLVRQLYRMDASPR